ncbi:hypothetical protein LMG28614_05982 [Paraburkholderia ultramafica]|uniref:Uncharacterized protein n=1 Tax=Paraburkholderia ultramafica TaxID=1544867 RepID=A0A6S7BL83_9BURK|nr:hypothetical protein LMG28614_05982 [Paraburkholderia ultramafica]
MIVFLDFDGVPHPFAERRTQPFRDIRTPEDALGDYTFN